MEQIQIRGHKLGLRTADCCERIAQVQRGDGEILGAMDVSRLTQNKSRARKKRQQIGGSRHREFAAQLLDASSQSSETHFAALSAMYSKEGQAGELAARFEAFKLALQANPLITASVQRMRFEMVRVLEKGTPGPPPDPGRRILKPGTVTAHEADVLGLGTSSKKKVTKSSARITPSSEYMRLNAQHSAEEAAARTLQGAFLRLQARIKRSMMKAVLLGHGGGQRSNPMSGAVELSWEDITGRLIRYVRDHFWEAGCAGETCVLVFEIWMTHLLKERTVFEAADGSTAGGPTTDTLRRYDPFDLSAEKRGGYTANQKGLDKLGVTALLAEVVTSRSFDVGRGRLPDDALELLIELLNGGNTAVQATLYDYLTQSDHEGKFLQHLERRIQVSFEHIQEAKRRNEGAGDSAKIQDISDECKSIISTARFLQLLCEGHYLPFQVTRSSPRETILFFD